MSRSSRHSHSSHSHDRRHDHSHGSNTSRKRKTIDGREDKESKRLKKESLAQLCRNMMAAASERDNATVRIIKFQNKIISALNEIAGDDTINSIPRNVIYLIHETPCSKRYKNTSANKNFVMLESAYRIILNKLIELVNNRKFYKDENYYDINFIIIGRLALYKFTDLINHNYNFNTLYHLILGYKELSAFQLKNVLSSLIVLYGYKTLNYQQLSELAKMLNLFDSRHFEKISSNDIEKGSRALYNICKFLSYHTLYFPSINLGVFNLLRKRLHEYIYEMPGLPKKINLLNNLLNMRIDKTVNENSREGKETVIQQLFRYMYRDVHSHTNELTYRDALILLNNIYFVGDLNESGIRYLARKSMKTIKDNRALIVGTDANKLLRSYHAINHKLVMLGSGCLVDEGAEDFCKHLIKKAQLTNVHNDISFLERAVRALLTAIVTEGFSLEVTSVEINKLLDCGLCPDMIIHWKDANASGKLHVEVDGKYHFCNVSAESKESVIKIQTKARNNLYELMGLDYVVVTQNQILQANQKNSITPLVAYIQYFEKALSRNVNTNIDVQSFGVGNYFHPGSDFTIFSHKFAYQTQAHNSHSRSVDDDGDEKMPQVTR